MPEIFSLRLQGGVLLLIGAFYFWRQWNGVAEFCTTILPGGHHQASEECGHSHTHSHWDDELKESELVSRKSGDWAAISGLFMMLTLSPCEGFLPVYLSGVQFGWRGFVVLSLILAVGTLAGMLVFTWLTLVGLERFQIQKFERYEAAMLGSIFTVLGVLLLRI